MMINYNCDDPKQRGYWYDGCITKKVHTFSHQVLCIQASSNGACVHACMPVCLFVCGVRVCNFLVPSY